MSRLNNFVQDFFSVSGSGKVLRAVVRSVMEELDKIQRIVEQMDGIRLYSSSLLIVYDAATVEAEETVSTSLSTSPPPPSSSSSSSSSAAKVKVKIIDFANSALPGDEVGHYNIYIKSTQYLHNIYRISKVSTQYQHFLHNIYVISTQVEHPGPDKGFLLGLHSLASILELLASL